MQLTDPTQITALQSLDFGSVYSSDGREHPLTGVTPVYVSSPDVNPTADPTMVNTTGTIAPASGSTPSVGSSVVSSVVSSLVPSLPPHFGARAIVAVVAIGILLIVVARLVLK